jgi:hypothetical protein
MWIVDLVGGDLSAALLLSQLLWWHQPAKSGRPKLRYEREGLLWLVRTDDDWWTDCRLTMRQVRRIRAQLESADLVEHKVVKIGLVTTSAWRPKMDVVQTALDRKDAMEDRESGVTPTRHSRVAVGLTPTRQSRTDANASLQWTDTNASLQSDANASVPSLLDPEVKEEQEEVAASRPPAQLRSDAEDLVRTWWEDSTPTPVSSFIGVVKIVERFLIAGYPDDIVAGALRSAPCPTVNALLIELKHAGPSEVTATQIMDWFTDEDEEGESTG